MNFGFWWESHEVFEKLWHRVGPKSSEGNFFQALIQLAAAQVKHHMGNDAAGERLLRKAMDRFTSAPQVYLGIDVVKLIQDIASRCFIEQTDSLCIRLNVPESERHENERRTLH